VSENTWQTRAKTMRRFGLQGFTGQAANFAHP
jgi:hypothetical protein